jgi:hypothetical protein
MTARLRVPPFSLKDSLECGQFFRFTKVMETFFSMTKCGILLILGQPLSTH